jgi:hypothetical protein
VAPVTLHLFYDANRNDSFDLGEGIRGINLFFLGGNGGSSVTGSLVTSDNGSGSLRIPVGTQRINIPYFGINIKLTHFPERELHSLWLQRAQLPDRVP